MSTVTKKIKSFDGESLFVSEHSNSSYPTETYLLLSGLGGCVTSWHWFIQSLLQLRPNSRCVTVDLRGHGLSTHNFSSKASDLMDCYAKDLEVLIQAYATNPVELVFVGHSFGCLILQEYLKEHSGDVFKKIVLVTAPIQIGKSWLKIPLAYSLLVTWSKLHPQAIRDHSLKEHLYYKNSFDLNFLRVLNDTKIMGKVMFALIWGALLGWKSTTTNSLNKQNIHRIFGTKDVFLSGGSQKKIQQTYPNCTYHFLPTNHNMVVNVPEAVADIVAKKN